MTPREFTKLYYPQARVSEEKTGVPAIVVLAQAALESAWGQVAPGNMFFGKKDSDGINGNEQLLLTTEYLDNPDKKFPAVISVVKVGQKLWKYKVKDWFRKYKTPEECFTDHAKLLSTSPRYKKAMASKDNPYLFAAEIHAAGYATDPDYTKKLHKLMDMIKVHM
jgi:flagellum-specific peptidoglycan hydrolase FlgJ